MSHADSTTSDAKTVQSVAGVCRALWWLHSGIRPGPSLDGGISAGGRHNTDFWNFAARFILADNIEPALFFLAQFSMPGASFRSPREFFNHSGLSRYNCFPRQLKVEQCRKLFELAQQALCQKMILSRRLTADEVMRSVVVGSDRTVPALYSCWLGQVRNVEVPRDTLEEAAAAYLIAKPFYDAGWPDIPSSVQAIAIQWPLWSADFRV